MSEQPRRGVLLALAAEGIVPVVGGCAGALAGGPEAGMIGGVVGVALGQTVEKAINFFGARIVNRWGEWFRGQPAEARKQALAELASMPAEEVRRQAESLLDDLVLEPISQADREVALSYLSLLPGALDRALPRSLNGGGRPLPTTVSLDEPLQLLSLMPLNLPPYPIGTEVPGTPYRLEALLGTGGFGAVYRASTKSLQHLPLAVKFCLDPSLALALNRERDNLERLMKAGGENWSPRIVRLYGYDLEHQTPYLVYEFVTGGDLIRHLADLRERLGRGLNHQETFDLIKQVAEALAFAHEHGLVHRDLKPANVLVEGGVLKLADFGLGGLMAVRAAQVSRIGATTVDQLRTADQASLFRGAGTPLYMAPEQRRGQAPDPRHDLFSMGVMWYQLLVGDVSRELHPGWAKELTVRHGVPRYHLELIERCVGWFDERPRNAGELLALMREKPAESAPLPAPTPVAATVRTPPPVTALPAAALTATAAPADGMREQILHTLVKQLESHHQKLSRYHQEMGTYLSAACVVGIAVYFGLGMNWGAVLVGLLLGGLVGAGIYLNSLGRRGDARERLKLTIHTLTSEFPEVVRSWGGEAVLRNAELVSQIARSLGLAPPPKPKEEEEQRVSSVATAPVDMPPLDPAQRKSLAAQLRPLAEEQREADSYGQRRPVPLVLALLLGLVLGGLVGAGVGGMFYGYRGPVYTSIFMKQMQFYDANLNLLNDGGHQREVRQMTTLAAALGIAAGVAVFGLIVALLTRRNWYRLRLLLGLFLGLVIGAPIGIGVAMLHYGMLSPYSNSVGFGNIEYFDARGNRLMVHEYELRDRQTLTTTLLLGIGTGALVALAVMLLYQRRYHRRAMQARQRLRAGVQQLAANFPQVVAARGGLETLMQPGQIQALLQAV